ncbi:MAG: hypothetical protein COV36_00310 [Alphaproteobacteria bacterium CG11_big_fil_rev_8_21_14_0_20_44_7]|nr:MAG: hypothetical protein COV36_00310 [Alphaproteobacteria bacterium CG11_big_fil_rev_8_21_14_0_20_44_7]
MRKFIIATLLASTFSLSAQGEELIEPKAEKEKIILVGDAWCPYNCEPDTDEEGFLVDLMREVFAEHDIEVEYKLVSFARALKGTADGDFDAVMAPNKGESEGLVVPETYQVISMYGIFKPSSIDWEYTGKASLKDVTFGAIDGVDIWPFDKYIEDNKQDNKLVQISASSESSKNMLKKLAKGRITAFMEDTAVVNYYLKELGLEAEVSPAGVGGLAVGKDGDFLYVCFSPKNPNAEKYAKILSDGTKELTESGRLDEIFAKYNFKRVTEEEYYEMEKKTESLLEGLQD